MLTTYLTTHIHSQTVGRAFAEGAGSRIVVGAADLQPGDAAFYGWLRGLEPLLKRAQREGRTWWYLDNGYFRPGHYGGYYRLTRSAYQHNGRGEGDLKRLAELGLRIRPWRKDGGNVLICPPGSLFATHLGFDADQWLDEVVAQVRRHTDRGVYVRRKSCKRPLEQDLDNAHCLITAFSNVAVEALMYGVPVFTTHPCAAACMGLQDLSEIENPFYPDDRIRWASVLASNQWTLDEMREGVPWTT